MSIKSTCENLQFSIEKTQITPLQELAPVGSLQLRMVFHGFVAKFYNDSRIFTLIWHSFGVQQTAANHCKPRFFTLQDSSKHCKILQNTAKYCKILQTAYFQTSCSVNKRANTHLKRNSGMPTTPQKRKSHLFALSHIDTEAPARTPRRMRASPGAHQTTPNHPAPAHRRTAQTAAATRGTAPVQNHPAHCSWLPWAIKEPLQQ
jgi:hypothetical protein